MQTKMTEEEIKKYKIKDNYVIPTEEINYMLYLFGRLEQQIEEQKEAIREAKSYIWEHRYREHNNDELTLNNNEIKGLIEILDQRCKYCKEHNGDDLIDMGYGYDDDYYSCELMNALDNEKYKCYISFENRVYEDNCKHYLCEKCEFKEKFEEYGLEHMDELIKKYDQWLD